MGSRSKPQLPGRLHPPRRSQVRHPLPRPLRREATLPRQGPRHPGARRHVPRQHWRVAVPRVLGAEWGGRTGSAGRNGSRGGAGQEGAASAQEWWWWWRRRREKAVESDWEVSWAWGTWERIEEEKEKRPGGGGGQRSQVGAGTFWAVLIFGGKFWLLIYLLFLLYSV